MNSTISASISPLYRLETTFIKTLAVFTFFVMVCSGCSHQPIVSHQYPLWGKTVFLHGESRNSPLHMQILTPESTEHINGCLLIVHGMNEYIGRYGDIANYFSDRYIVAGVDLTAHGLSNPVLLAAHQSLTSGKQTYSVGDAFFEQEQLSDLQPMRDDLSLAVEYLNNHCSEVQTTQQLPIFIISHSLGSLVTASYLLQSAGQPIEEKIKGLIFTGPAFSVTQVPGWRGWLQNPVVRFSYYSHEQYLNPHNGPLPIMIFNQLLALITVPLQNAIIELLSSPGARSLFSPTTPDWVVQYLFDWEAERVKYRADNYIIRRTMLNYVLGVEQEIIHFRNKMAQLEVPYLLIYSEYDPITPAWGNTDFFAATSHNHIDNESMRLDGHSHHEQLFSSPLLRKQILQKIDSWLKQRQHLLPM